MAEYTYNPPRPEPQKNTQSPQSEEVFFPWAMFLIALFFDLIGVIPILNIFTEVLATMIFSFWHMQYAPKSDYLANLIITKCCDFASLGLFPSNIAIVIMAYSKKKARSELPTTNKITGKPAVV
jgi:hypothetical protein